MTKTVNLELRNVPDDVTEELLLAFIRQRVTVAFGSQIGVIDTANRPLTLAERFGPRFGKKMRYEVAMVEGFEDLEAELKAVIEKDVINLLHSVSIERQISLQYPSDRSELQTLIPELIETLACVPFILSEKEAFPIDVFAENQPKILYHDCKIEGVSLTPNLGYSVRINIGEISREGN